MRLFFEMTGWNYCCRLIGQTGYPWHPIDRTDDSWHPTGYTDYPWSLRALAIPRALAVAQQDFPLGIADFRSSVKKEKKLKGKEVIFSVDVTWDKDSLVLSCFLPRPSTNWPVESLLYKRSFILYFPETREQGMH